MPWADDLFFAFFPHDRIALASRDDNCAARTMAVRLLIRLRRKHRHVSSEFGIGELHEHAFAAGTAPLVGVELVPGAHVGEKVAIPVSYTHLTLPTSDL